MDMENIFRINLTFDNEATFDTFFEDQGGDFNTDFGETTTVTTSDHRELTHRDATMQHPIASITDLTDELEVRPDEYMSNMEIYEILQG